MIINRNNLNTLFVAFNAAFQNQFNGTPIDYDQLVLRVPSTTSSEEYGWLGMTTRFREWIGDRVFQSIKTHGYTIKNKKFENSVEVSRDAIEDDQYGVYTPLFSQMGQDSKEHPAELVYGLLKAGFTTPCYDGQYFFDTDHPVLNADGSEGTVSNFAGGSGAPWFLLDTTRVMKPIILQTRREYNFVAMDKLDDEGVFLRDTYRYGVDARLNVGFGLWQLAYASKNTLDAAGLNAAIAAMQGMKGDNGRPLGIRPKILVVGPSMRDTALTLVKAAQAANGATNINKDVVDVLVTPWLA